MGKKAIKLMLKDTLKKLGYKNQGGSRVEILYDNDEV